MPEISRRLFIGGAATAAAGAAAVGAAPGTAFAATTEGAAQGDGENPTKSLRDIKHVIVFMQENRSFDHYFGSLRGVRGFGDRTAISLPDGNPVFQQPNGSSSQYPWPLAGNAETDGYTGEDLGQCSGSLDHSWDTQHEAFNGGKLDQWIPAKGIRTMGYLTRDDIPYQYALADSYTTGDAYHCSVLSATGPNRTYLWSGMIDPAATAGGPAYDGGGESGLSYQTYAEALQDAGVTWKVYQSYDNYGDNGLEYFTQFGPYTSNAYGAISELPPGSPLYPGVEMVPGSASQTGDIADLITAGILADLAAGTLPQVSWIVPNQQYSEHPYASPDAGAYFVNMVLQALAQYPDVLHSTAIILDYDENDGLFDHVPPPVAEAGTEGEYIPGTNSATAGLPIGLGFRVPLTIISPWTRGGYVSSELADHTSVVQFLERWTTAIGKPAKCQYISDWRRNVSSDLVSFFDFEHPVYGLPGDLPATTNQYSMTFCGPLPSPSVVSSEMPAQETGTRPAKPLPYQVSANVAGFGASATSDIAISLKLANTGQFATSGTHFWVYSNSGNTTGPWPYTLGPDAGPAKESSAWAPSRVVTVDIGTGLGAGAYDLTLIGPNRYRADFLGNATTAGATAEATVSHDESRDGNVTGLLLELANDSQSDVTFSVTSNYYASGKEARTVRGRQRAELDLTSDFAADGWYDFTVTVDSDSSWSRRFTGHLENGRVSVTG
jgi:phospholipase C